MFVLGSEGSSTGQTKYNNITFDKVKRSQKPRFMLFELKLTDNSGSKTNFIPDKP